MKTLVPIALLFCFLAPPAYAAEKGFDTKLTVNFVETPLTDALTYVAMVARVHVILDPRTDASKLEISLKLTDITAKSALTHLTAALGLAWDERWGGAFVATKERLKALPKDPLPLPAEGKEPEESAALRKRLATLRSTFDFQETPLSDCLSYVRFVHSFNAVGDDALGGRLKTTTFTGKVSDAKLGDALAVLLVPSGLTAEILEGVLFVRKGGDRKPPGKRAPKRGVPKVLEETRLSVNFLDTDLREVLIYLGKRTGYPVHLDPDVYRVGTAEKWKVTLTTKTSVPVRGLLDLVTITKKLDWDIRWGGVFVASKERLAALPTGLLPTAKTVDPKAWEVALAKRLTETKISFDYQEVGLITALSRIRDRGAVNILIEPKAARAMAKMEVDLRVTRQPLAEVLTLLLVPRGFTFQLKHEVVVVGLAGTE